MSKGRRSEDPGPPEIRLAVTMNSDAGVYELPNTCCTARVDTMVGPDDVSGHGVVYPSGIPSQTPRPSLPLHSEHS